MDVLVYFLLELSAVFGLWSEHRQCKFGLRPLMMSLSRANLAEQKTSSLLGIIEW